METFSALLAICAGNSPVPGEFPAQRPVTRSFDVLFDLRPNKRLSKQSWDWWFETLSRPLWRHFNELRLQREYSYWCATYIMEIDSFPIMLRFMFILLALERQGIPCYSCFTACKIDHRSGLRDNILCISSWKEYQPSCKIINPIIWHISIFDTSVSKVTELLGT